MMLISVWWFTSMIVWSFVCGYTLACSVAKEKGK